jgi:hypothetical protein
MSELEFTVGHRDEVVARGDNSNVGFRCRLGLDNIDEVTIVQPTTEAQVKIEDLQFKGAVG